MTAPIHPRLSVNALCFPEADLAQAGRYWREIGCARVGAPSTLIGEDLAPLREILKSGPFQLECLTHLVFGDRPLPREGPDWDEARARLDRAIDNAAALGGQSVYLITGGHGDVTWEEAAERFSAGIAPCVARAEAAGIKLLVEPAPAIYSDMHIAHSLGDTLLLAQMAGIGVCVDVVSCWSEAGLKETIERAMPRTWLVQLGDYVAGDRAMPYRAVPGDGDIPLERILGWLLEAGYNGVFDLELIGPRIDAEGHLEATRRAAIVVSEMLRSLGA
jgi:sugar phosphate isomerase/epimerase